MFTTKTALRVLRMLSRRFFLFIYFFFYRFSGSFVFSISCSRARQTLKIHLRASFSAVVVRTVRTDAHRTYIVSRRQYYCKDVIWPEEKRVVGVDRRARHRKRVHFDGRGCCTSNRRSNRREINPRTRDLPVVSTFRKTFFPIGFRFSQSLLERMPFHPCTRSPPSVPGISGSSPLLIFLRRKMTEMYRLKYCAMQVSSRQPRVGKGTFTLRRLDAAYFAILI